MSPRFKFLAAAFLVSASPALSADPALRGIETADMDRAADALYDRIARTARTAAPALDVAGRAA